MIDRTYGKRVCENEIRDDRFFLHGSIWIADDYFHVTSYRDFPCITGLLSTTKYINEERKSSVQICPQVKNTSSPQPIEKHNVADCAVLVQLLYIFYDAHLWLNVCLANTAVMAISH